MPECAARRIWKLLHEAPQKLRTGMHAGITRADGVRDSRFLSAARFGMTKESASRVRGHRQPPERTGTVRRVNFDPAGSFSFRYFPSLHSTPRILRLSEKFNML